MRGGQIFRDVVADENAHDDDFRMKLPNVLVQNLPVFARPGGGDSKVINLHVRNLLLQQSQEVVGKGHCRSDGKGVTQYGQAPNARSLVPLKIRAGIAEVVTSKSSAVIMTRNKLVGVDGVGNQHGLPQAGAVKSETILRQEKREGHVEGGEFKKSGGLPPYQANGIEPRMLPYPKPD